MRRGEEVHTAIQVCDTATLLRMAAEARREEDRIFQLCWLNFSIGSQSWLLRPEDTTTAGSL